MSRMLLCLPASVASEVACLGAVAESHNQILQAWHRWKCKISFKKRKFSPDYYNRKLELKAREESLHAAVASDCNISTSSQPVVKSAAVHIPDIDFKEPLWAAVL